MAIYDLRGTTEMYVNLSTSYCCKQKDTHRPIYNLFLRHLITVLYGCERHCFGPMLGKYLSETIELLNI